MEYSINPLIEKVIKKLMNGDGFPSHKQVVRYLEKNHPEAVDKYLTSHRQSLLGGVVTRQLAFQRNKLRKSSLASRLMDGSADNVFDLKTFWATPFYVPGEDWKTLGELTGDDHTAIAEKYEIAEVAANSRAQLHRRLAEQVGSLTTKEVFDPKKLLREIDYAYDTSKQLSGGTG